MDSHCAAATAPTSRPDAQRHHLQWLVLCAAVVVASALLNPEPRGLAPPALPWLTLPSICLTHTLLHMNCPGCGLTRSFVAMAHGHLRAAYAQHRVGPVIFLLVLLQIPLRAYAVFTGRLPRWAARPRLGELIGLVLFVALLANWVYNAFTGAIWAS
jgi:hypothetical protein